MIFGGRKIKDGVNDLEAMRQALDRPSPTVPPKHGYSRPPSIHATSATAAEARAYSEAVTVLSASIRTLSPRLRASALKEALTMSVDRRNAHTIAQELERIFYEELKRG